MKTIWKYFALNLVLATSSSYAFGNVSTEPKIPAESKITAVESVLTLKSIVAETADSKTNVTLEFDGVFAGTKPTVEDHGSFIQFDLKNTIVINPGNFMDGSGPYIQKIVAFQPSPKDAALRFFVDKKAADLIPAIHLDILEKRVLLTLDHAKIARNDSVADKLAAVSSHMAKGETSLVADAPAAANVAPVDAEPLPTEKLTQNSAASDDLRSKMVIAAIFCIILLAFGAAAIVFKPTLRKKFGHVESEIPSFKTLSSHSVGPKQKIAVIKVGSERLLVGVTPGSITLLKNLDEQPVRMSAQSFAQPQLPPERPRPSEAPKNIPDRSSIQRVISKATKPELNAYQASKTSATLPSSDYEGVEVSLSSRAAAQTSTRRLAKPTLPRPAPKGKPGSVDDVTKLIREKLKNLPQAT